MRVSRERTRRDVPYRIPSWSDPVVARATCVVGGPLGRYAVVGARGLVGAAASLALLGTAMLALGVWQKGHCLMKGWTTPDQFWRACYSDLPVVHVSSPLASRSLPWSGEIPSDQAPLSGLVMWLVARVSPSAGPGVAAQDWIFVIWALVCVLLLVVATVAAVAMLPRDPWHAAHLAVSPVLVTLALVSTDLLGVALTLLGVWAWRRGHGWLGGGLLGLAVLVRPFPLLWIAAIVLVTLRRRSSREEVLQAAQVVVGAVLAALAVVVPLQLVEPRSLTGAVDWWGQEAGYGALQMVPRLFGAPLSAYIQQPAEQFQAFVDPGMPIDFARWNIWVIALPLMIISAVTTHFNARLSVSRQSAEAAANPQAAIMNRMMLWIFPIGILVTGAFLPVAILIYMVVNNGWTFGQQRFLFGRMAKEDDEAARKRREHLDSLAPKVGVKPTNPKRCWAREPGSCA